MENKLLEAPYPSQATNKANRHSSIKADTYRDSFLNRTGKLLSRRALNKLRDTHILIAGCGGVGGAVAVTMARMGVEHFTLADPGIFDEPDINRQWAADTSTLGMNKATVYRKRLHKINPSIKVNVFEQGVTWKNVSAILEGVDIVVDCLDITVPMKLRARMFQRAREQGSYAITAPVLGFGTFIAIASPKGLSMEPILARLSDTSDNHQMPKAFHRFYSPSCMEAMEDAMGNGQLPSLSIGPVLAGALVSTELLLILLKGHIKPWRKPVCLPNVLMVDPFTSRFEVAKLSDLF